MKLTALKRRLDLTTPFRVSFGEISGLDVVAVALEGGGVVGRGEACPMPMFGHTAEAVLNALAAIAPDIEAGRVDRIALQSRLPAGPARNALDCAFWDHEAKAAGRSVWELTGLSAPDQLDSDVTIGIETPEETARLAATHRYAGMIKLKLGGPSDMACVRAVRQTLPDVRLFVDVNGGWTLEQLNALAPELAALDVFMIEQPLPRGEDEQLDGYTGSVPLCADESCQDRSDLDRLEGRYAFVNIKLDKTGGLTEALALAREAEARGMRLMVGCMMGSGLAMAPAYLVGTLCEVVDLDVSLLLKNPADTAVRHDGRRLSLFDRTVWG
ncbi:MULTISPECIES: dipeptide epimerase [unclassified Brevundimonas]|uniref:dipeptide epimerase n=1 Tax=unclassified Brevundimonas TaxID=2622653 RepID=UPI0025C15797|nr:MULTISPECIES: dipeptide epimerase [unclassified Brevundimonas]